MACDRTYSRCLFTKVKNMAPELDMLILRVLIHRDILNSVLNTASRREYEAMQQSMPDRMLYTAPTCKDRLVNSPRTLKRTSRKL